MQRELCLADLPEILTVKEAAAYLRLSKSSAYEAIRLKRIPSVKIGRRILIPKSAMKEVIEAPTER